MRSSSRLLLLPLLALESLRIGGERDMNGCGEGKAEGRTGTTTTPQMNLSYYRIS